MHSAYAANLVSQKIRVLDILVKSLEKISYMLKKVFVYLDLNKKSAKKLQTSLDRYIKVISFTICFRHSFYHKLLNLVNRINQIKLNKHIVWNK